MRKLRVGEEVLDPSGRRVGLVERLVVDEQAHRVTHLVLRDRVVGVGHFRDLDGAHLRVDMDEAGVLRQPEAAPEFVGDPGAHWRAPGGYSIGDFLRIASALIGQSPYVPPVHLDLDLSAVHEITPGSPVFAGREHVGDVSEVLTDEDGRVTSLVLRRPGLHGERRLLPAGRVIEVIGNAVHADLDHGALEALTEYR